MSHFTVLVIGDNPEEQLAPFQENNMGDCPKEYMEFEEYDLVEAEKEYNEDTFTKIKMPDGRLLNKWDDEFRVNGSLGIGSGTHKVPEHLPEVEIPMKELYSSLESFVEEYHGWRRDEETGKYGKWDNPNKKWDWYQLGGRWRGFFKVKNGRAAVVGEAGLFGGPAEPEHGDQLLKCDIDFEGMRESARIEAERKYDLAMSIFGHLPVNESLTSLGKRLSYSDEARRIYHSSPRVVAFNEANQKNRDNKDWPFGFFSSVDDFIVTREEYVQTAVDGSVATFAVIRDGKWYEKGSMGWWGAVSDKKEETAWNKEFAKLIDDLDDNTLLSVYDCHI